MDSSQIIDKPSSWPANRRYFFLIRSFAEIGVLRCDHFLPEKTCFNKIKNQKKNYYILTVEKILVQLKLNHNNLITSIKNQYTYLYKAHNSIRSLKNIMISQPNQKPSHIFIFDYLNNNEEKIRKIILIMELFHYSIKNCQLKPILLSFVEGELAFNHLLKKLYRPNSYRSINKQANTLFRQNGYLSIQNKKIIKNSFLKIKDLNKLSVVKNYKSSFFCQ